jgi:hypothetical protein
MTNFRMSRLPATEARVENLASAMKRYELQPSYQRQSDVWSEEKRALFIDSLINGYDVPKLYFHRLVPTGRGSHLYAIVDGKQRLEAIRAFLDDRFPLSEEFEDNESDRGSEAAGKSYSALTSKHPAVANRLTGRSLDIVVIDTDDLGVIEELFSRLNEAVPLNAPEKRNALGGPLPRIIRELVKSHPFFTERLSIENTRYKQYDLVTKFLYLVDKQGFGAIKKRDLDEFVIRYRDNAGMVEKAKKLEKDTSAILTRMTKVFEEQDDLLRSVGLVTVYFMAFLLGKKDPRLLKKLKRERLHDFDHLRKQNRLILRDQQTAIADGKPVPMGIIRQDLAIFDRLMQSPNDAQALEYRYRILRAFLDKKKFVDDLPEDLKRRMADR